MAVSKFDILNRINIALGSATEPTDIASLIDAQRTIESISFSVPTLADLPDASLNTGRMIWVDAIADYRISDGVEWGRKFNSTIQYLSTIMSWGSNSGGRLGDGTTVVKSSPVSVVGGFTDWCQVSAGVTHSIAIKQDCTLWSWGSNSNGQLGTGNFTSATSPVSVVGGFTDWCQVSASAYFNLAIRTNGTIWGWGVNNNGQLSIYDTASFQTSPVSALGGFTDWCQVSAGYRHALGVRSNCTLWAWGNNGWGQLGDLTFTYQSSPVSVVGGFTDWSFASAGCRHSTALRTNGTVWAWGYNSSGQLGNGDGTVAYTQSPVSVVGGFTDWCQVSAGDSHSAAIRTNGTLWAWGNNAIGRLGDGSTLNKSSPVSVVGGFTDWCQVSAGRSHSTAVRSNGTIWTWGCNSTGQLGDYTSINKSSPVSVVGGFTDWCQTSSGCSHTLAIRYKIVGF